MGIWVLSLIFTLFDSFLANVKLVTHSWIPKIRNYWWVELCMMSCNCVFFFPLFLLYFFPKFHYMESVSGATAQFTQQWNMSTQSMMDCIQNHCFTLYLFSKFLYKIHMESVSGANKLMIHELSFSIRDPQSTKFGKYRKWYWS